jgi:hypothetical protein
MQGLFSFPDPVNEVSARLVAGGVFVLCVLTIALDVPWLLIVETLHESPRKRARLAVVAVPPAVRGDLKQSPKAGALAP